MPEIIQFASGETMLNSLAEADALVSGMSASEAYSALHLHENAGGIATGVHVTGGGKVLEFPGGTAAEAFESVTDISSAGAATGAASETYSWALYDKLAEAGTAVGGVLTMSMPAWTAAAAPVLGVSIGYLMYRASPEFWTKVSQTLLPFAWNGTEAMPAITDADGQVYISEDAIEALRRLFEEEGIGKSAGHTSDLNTGPYGMPVPSGRPSVYGVKSVPYKDLTRTIYCVASVQVPDGVTIFFAPRANATNDSVALVAAKSRLSINQQWAYYDAVTGEHIRTSTGAFTLNSSYSYKGKTVYYSPAGGLGVAAAIAEFIGLTTSTPFPGASGSYPGNAAWTMVYGDELPGEYPEGVTKWEGQQQGSGTRVSVHTDSTHTTPYYPVYPPAGDTPGETVDPERVPNPEFTPTPAPELDPYIKPTVDPNQYPQEVPVPDADQRTEPTPQVVPNNKPNLDPSINPSEEPAPDPDPEPNPDPVPPIKGGPISGGISPPVIIPIPPISIVPSSGGGLVHVYNPTPDEMIAFGNWLWVTYADPSIEKLWNNPFDGVISAHELYSTPATDGSDNIRSGFLVCPTTAKLVRQRYTDINCGTLVIPEYYANYLDYSPYTKASVYLPFIGIVELDSDDIVGHAVNIVYHVDAYNGSCIAQITVARTDYSNTVYQFSGNCAVDIPLAGGSQSAIRAALISSAAQGIGSVIGGIASGLSGNIGGAVSQIAGGVSNAIANAVTAKSTVQHSGTFGASYGAMGIKKPYLIIRRPIQKQVINYNDEYGFPAHKMVRIGDCHGYLRAREIDVISPTATNEEKSMIEKMLKEGVFVDD